MRRTVIVNLREESSAALRGVLWSVSGSWLTLKNVEALNSGAPATRMDGEAVIHRSNVSFLQVLP